MPQRLSRRLVPVALLLISLVAIASLRSVQGPGLARARACPPGSVPAARVFAAQERERRAQVSGLRGGAGERDGTPQACRALRAPEGSADLLAMQGDSGRRARGGQPALKAGAYAAGAREAAALPSTGGTWSPVGTTPLLADAAGFSSVNGEGLADLAGRVADYAYDPDAKRLFAAVGEGGVWASDDLGGHWRSIGDGLPTQAVGGIAYAGGTLVIVTGDNVFGGGGTFAGLGAFRSTDGGATWSRSDGVPSGVIAFKVAADPNDPRVFYAATGAGLFRSTDAGATFTDVALPTSPDCAGAAPDKRGCALANMVTDVVVQGPANAQTPGGTPGAVLAAVGWRAGDKTSQYGYVESPGNGIYRSDTGAPGSFAKAGGFTPTTHPGRIELGAATGGAQDHRYVYALVEDAAKFNGEPPLDVPLNQATPYPTNFGGVYVSSDFGQTWTLMESAEEMVADASSGSALNGTACAASQYCPGVQSWYNQWIAPDPTRTDAAGVPTRLAFGLEEVWAGSGAPMSGPAKFDVVGPYFSGSTCLFLNVGHECPTTHSDPTAFNTTTHPDQHAGRWVPSGSGVTLLAGNDGGAYAQALGSGDELSPDRWGRGANLGFHTLLPYDAQVAADGTVWAGLQDNGELKIEPGGRQVETYGGDGTFSAVDPVHSDTAYEATPQNSMSKTTDGGKTWSDVSPPSDTYQFANPFALDPVDASHLLTAGTKVHETTDGAGTWTTVYDLGTRTHPGDAAASPAAGDPDNVVSALDVRGAGTPAPVGKATPGFSFDGGTGTLPGAGSDAPGTYVDRPFTIAADEGDRSAAIAVSWADGNLDWDLLVYRQDGANLVEVGSSEQGPPSTTERVVLSRPAPGSYVIRVRNFAAAGSFSGTAAFEAAQPGDMVAGASAAYVAFCGYCDALNTKPFHNGIATNVGADGSSGRPGSATGWHIAAAHGLPQRYITSVQMDPSDARTVYVTLAGYSRRWLRPGVLGPDEGADVGGGHVFKSTDAGETFADVSGDLPDVPADFAIVRNGQLIVATDLGVFVGDGTSYAALGSGLPAVPVLSLELKPDDPGILVVATQGRGVYCYAFDKAGCGPGLAGPNPAVAAAPAAQGGTASPKAGASCTADAASVAVKPSGRRLRFAPAAKAPIEVVRETSRGAHRVARFAKPSRAFTWAAAVPDGYYVVRAGAGTLVLRRSHGRWSPRPAYRMTAGCGGVRSFTLSRPVFGSTLAIAVRLAQPTPIRVTVRRGKAVVHRYRATGRTLRATLRARPRGDYRVTLEGAGVTLTSRRL
jgi:photosystem II stability/assembly factor-like uncharacterized protein